MTREARTIFVSVLTMILFAVSMFISQGSLIFPFPLNEFVFLAVAVQFFFWNSKTHPIAGITAIVGGIIAVLSTQFFWTFFYSPEEMMTFMDGLTTDYLQIGFYLIVFIAIVATFLKQNNTPAIFLSILSLIPFVLAAWSYNSFFFMLSYGLMVASTQVKTVYAPYHLLWVLLFALETTECLTVILNMGSVTT